MAKLDTLEIDVKLNTDVFKKQLEEVKEKIYSMYPSSVHYTTSRNETINKGINIMNFKKGQKYFMSKTSNSSDSANATFIGVTPESVMQQHNAPTKVYEITIKELGIYVKEPNNNYETRKMTEAELKDLKKRKEFFESLMNDPLVNNRFKY